MHSKINRIIKSLADESYAPNPVRREYIQKKNSPKKRPLGIPTFTDKLVWKFLKAGYMEDWKYHNTYSGCPQGGIVSPMLSNIYLNELDKFAENLAKEFYKSRVRHHTPEYDKIAWQISQTKKRLKSAEGQEKTDLLTLLKQQKAEMHKTPCMSKTVITKYTILETI